MESLAQLLVDGCINLAKLNLAFEVLGSLSILWLKSLAVSAPGSIKLDDPNVLGLHHKGVEIRLFKHYNSIVHVGTRRTTASGVLFLASKTILGCLADLLKSEVHEAIGISTHVVVLRLLLVAAKPLEGREALDCKLLANLLLRVHVDCSKLHDALEGFGCLIVAWSHVLAVTTPGRVELN